MNAPFGKKLETACRSYAYRTATRLHAQADRLAERAASLEVGGVEWQSVMAEFVRVSRRAEALGFPVAK